MNTVSRLLIRFDSLLAQGEALVLVAILVAMTVVVLLQVIYRYFLTQPLHWSEELARYLFVWLSVLGAANGLQKRGHFGFDALVRMLPRRAMPFMTVLIHALMGVVVFVMLVHGITLVEKTLPQESPAMGISMGWAYASLPVGGVLMASHLIVILIKEMGRKKNNLL
jgi:TRAP-type C4-dicarboxylate transport system permease small subunit